MVNDDATKTVRETLSGLGPDGLSAVLEAIREVYGVTVVVADAGVPERGSNNGPEEVPSGHSAAADLSEAEGQQLVAAVESVNLATSDLALRLNGMHNMMQSVIRDLREARRSFVEAREV